MPERIGTQDHYRILNLPTSLGAANDLSEKTIKSAYRCALLEHHPDKSGVSQSSKSKHSVDQITIAYKTLINPVCRSEYDTLRALQQSRPSAHAEATHSGLEIVDLDELLYDEAQGIWYRSCRCGKDRSFLITEEELEKNAEHGEIVAGCSGCSIWLRVTFAVANGAYS